MMRRGAISLDRLLLFCVYMGANTFLTLTLGGKKRKSCHSVFQVHRHPTEVIPYGGTRIVWGKYLICATAKSEDNRTKVLLTYNTGLYYENQNPRIPDVNLHPSAQA